MMHALLVCADPGVFSQTASVFAENNISTVRVESGAKALIMVREQSFDFIIADEILPDMTGLDFAKRLISINPMLNLALISSLSSEEFHEAGEGLGIMMQLPKSPDPSDVLKLLTHVNKILSLTHQIK
jgi:DNA-binding response OmpR family regulator